MRHLTEDEIEKYVMGKMSEGEAVRAEEHLFICDACRNELELMGLILSGLREENVQSSSSRD